MFSSQYQKQSFDNGAYIFKDFYFYFVENILKMNFILVVTLPVEKSSNLFYRVKVECFENSITLLIFDGSSAFKGEMSPEYISNQSKIFNLSSREYIEECRKAFQNSQSREFTYGIADDFFYLKRTIETNSANSIKVKFASIKLEKVDFEASVLTVLDITLDENNRFMKKVEELQSINETLKQGNKLLQEQLRQLQNAKNEMENILYARFLNLLNSKKKKIKELKRNSGLNVEEDTVSEIDDEMDLENKVLDNVYDIDTDVDEETEDVKDKFKIEEIAAHDEPSNFEPVEQVKKEWKIKDHMDSKKSSSNDVENNKTRSIFYHMSILDPTIPFVP